MRMHVTAVVIAVSALAGCGNGGGTVDAGAVADAPVVADAAPDGAPDAFELCPGRTLFTGEYIDWDSSVSSFHGVADATVTDVTDSSLTDQTSPNGRWEVCVPSATDGLFSFTQTDYLPLLYTMDADSIATGIPTVRGLTPARADELFSGMGGPTRDTGKAQLMIDVRRYPADTPVDGATVDIGSTLNDGAWARDATAGLSASATTAAGGLIWFINVDTTPANTGDVGREVAVTVTPPTGITCVGPATVHVEAGKMAAASFACQ